MPVKGNIRRRPKRHFGYVAAICIAAFGMAATSMGVVSDATSGQTSQILAQEPSHAFSAESIPNSAVITALKTVLPSHVYVLNNREIVTHKPLSETDKLEGIAEVPSSHSETNSHCATIRASVTVASSRLIVVDENDTIVEIWSNTTGMKRSFYSLRVKEQHWQGLEHPLTPGILAQYNRLLAEVDWSNTGRVY
ncbi:hypothetical protein ES703_86851 [subsurface metagenome]